jgi:hypothetical protein
MTNDFREHFIKKLKAIDYHDIVENEMTETINYSKIADVVQETIKEQIQKAIGRMGDHNAE